MGNGSTAILPSIATPRQNKSKRKTSQPNHDKHELVNAQSWILEKIVSIIKVFVVKYVETFEESKAMNKQAQQLCEQAEKKPRLVPSGLLSISAIVSSSFLAILCLAGCATASNTQVQIHDAAYLGDLEKIRALIAADPAVVDAKDNDGFTPLCIATYQGHLEVVKVLLEKGATVDAKANDGFTPLCIAANQGYFEVVKVLLEKGANPNIETLGFTPLMVAEKMGHNEIAKLLRKAGAK